MKKSIIQVILFFFCCVSPSFAGVLRVGERAPDFSLKDSKGNAYTLQSPEFQGRVLAIFYTDHDKKDLNNHVECALRQDPGIDRQNSYRGLGIANLKSSKLPNILIKSAIKDKQEKTGAIILLDYDYTILNLWGLKNKTSDIIVLDKEKICRYVYNGKLPQEEVKKILSVIKEYQVK